jgi:predicted deacetylase
MSFVELWGNHNMLKEAYPTYGAHAQKAAIPRIKFPPAIVAIHDVMPRTLPEVLKILQRLRALNISPVTVLVVSGLEWTEKEIAILRDLQQAGHQLAGHGWKHQCFGEKTFGHTLHSVLMSRNEAEHLSLQPQQICDLLVCSFQWFQDMGLQAPALYVPPAWAMGQITRKALTDLPFRMYEYLTGVYDSRRNIVFRLPVVGYLADTPSRVWVLRFLNALNRSYAMMLGCPLRIAIHPFDFHLGLASDLKALLKRQTLFLNYTHL